MMRHDTVNWSRSEDDLSIRTLPTRRLHRVWARWTTLLILVQAMITMGCVVTLELWSDAFPFSFRGYTINLTQVAIIVSTCLMIAFSKPWAQVQLRRWTTGLGQLHCELRRIASGAEPRPLTTAGEDEIDYLLIAFNEMASQVLSSRTKLVDANNRLESTVTRRTQQLAETARQMEVLACTDPLTGLSNRRAMQTSLESMMTHSRRNDAEPVCIAIDLDKFKQVNDALGHEIGDQVLKCAANVLRENSRSMDIVARLGGDEFALVVGLQDIDHASGLAGKLIKEFESRVVADIPSLPIGLRPSMSIGIAARSRIDPDSPDALLIAADQALYEAKRAGRSCFRWHHRDDQTGSSCAA